MKKLLLLSAMLMLSGCQIFPSTIPLGQFKYKGISLEKGKEIKLTGKKRKYYYPDSLILTFWSDIDFSEITSLTLVCLDKKNKKTTHKDFETKSIAFPKNGIMVGSLRKTKPHNNGFIHIAKFILPRAPIRISSDVTCSFINIRILPMITKRYISSPIIIPKQDILQLLDKEQLHKQ